MVQITPCVVLLVFSFMFQLLHQAKGNNTDSTQSKDHKTDQQTLPETLVPDTEVLITVRPQITFLWHNCINEIFNVVTFTANATYIIPTFPNLPVTVNTLHISDALSLHRYITLHIQYFGYPLCCMAARLGSAH